MGYTNATAFQLDMVHHVSPWWDSTHPLHNLYMKLFSALVPALGEADTEEGQMLRYVSLFFYERYNNGFTNPITKVTTKVNPLLKKHKLGMLSKKMSGASLDALVENLVIKIVSSDVVVVKKNEMRHPKRKTT